MEILLNIIILFFLDIILSVDNAILIASTTKELEEKPRKIAQILGASAAVLLRLLFVILILTVLSFGATIPFIYIVGGLILCLIGLVITNPKSEHEDKKKKAANSIMKAVILIIAGDIMLSFDNAFIIANVAINIDVAVWLQITIIAVALLLSLIILLFFAKQLSAIMTKHTWIIYIASWLLVSVGIDMLFKDELIHLESIAITIFSYALGALLVFGKFVLVDERIRNKKNEK